MKKQKAWNPAKSKRKLDRLFSEYILARDKRICQWCGQSSRDVKVWEERVAEAKEILAKIENHPPSKTDKWPQWKKRIAKQKAYLTKVIAKDGDMFKMDNSHIIPREVLSTRWLIQGKSNSQTLCYNCHKAGSKTGRGWHNNPLAAVKWLRGLLGDEWCDELLRLAEQPYEFTREEAARIEAELKAAIKALPTPICATQTKAEVAKPVP